MIGNNNDNNYKLSEPFNYQNDYEYGLNDQFSFWNDVARKYVHWDKEYDNVYNGNNEWFKGGLLNMCYNALDKHIINGRGNEIAFVHEIPLKQITYQITYKELYDKVCRLSRSLKNMGIKKGDVVLIYMHNCFELIISMLACSRIGAIHNVLFGCFLSDNLIETINRCRPATIIVSNYGYVFGEINNFYESLIDIYLTTNSTTENLSTKVFRPNNIILYKRKDFKNGADSSLNNSQMIIDGILDWDELVNDSIEPLIEYELLESNHPLYILFSSGTTNKPKAIQRETAGYIVGANYSLRSNYGLKEGDSFFSRASFGWINGHTMLIYGSLLVGVKSIFLEGSFNDSVNEYWKLVEKYKINVLSTTPISVRMQIKEDPNGEIASKYNLSSLKKITISAEKAHQSIIDYLNKIIGRKIVCNEYGLSETSGVLLVNASTQLSISNDSIGKPTPGYNVKILSKSKDNQVIENKANQIGEIVIKQPVFPYVSLSLFGDDDNQTLYKEYYLNEYNGYVRTKDLGYFDENGLWYYYSRADNSISVGGYTLNTAVIENEILKHSNVNDCCVIGLEDEINYQVPFGFIILQNNINNNNEYKDINYNTLYINQLKNEINSIITNKLSFGANLNQIIIVDEFPKTKSGKKIKSILTSIINNKELNIPSSIQDIKVIDQLLDKYKIFKNINKNIIIESLIK